VSAPATIDGVRTLVIPTSARAVAFGSAPQTPVESTLPPLVPAAHNAALSTKQSVARNLMQRNLAFFGIGVGQSLDNPKEAALVVYVDRNRIPAELPQTIGGLRTRYIVMDRMHVTRSYTAPAQSRLHCMPHSAADQPTGFNPLSLFQRRSLKLN